MLGRFTGTQLGPAYFLGTKPIDGVWAIPDVVITGASVILAGYSIGNPLLFVIDFLTMSVVWDQLQKLMKSAAYQLNTRVWQSSRKWNILLEEKLAWYGFIECLGIAHNSSNNKRVVEESIYRIDTEGNDYISFPEKMCQPIKSGWIPFSPKLVVLIKHRHSY